MGSGGCFSRWIVESLSWRCIPEIWSGVSGRRSSSSPRSSSRAGTNRAHWRGCSRRAMLKSLVDAVMERRARQLMEQVGAWLPTEGPLLDLGSGTGHLSARLERELGLEVVTADVSDIHVVGRPPVLIADGVLPFEEGTFSAALLFFMLAYPNDPAGVLAEAARVTRGPIILVQSLHSGRLGYAWLRLREFLWTIVAFHVSKVLGYVPPDAKFTMNTRRFYTAQELRRDVAAAGLQVRSRRERPVLTGRSLVVAGWILERDE
ncbi:MAG: methyltransferase domain-containing protein [Gemmatimonas sp.]|nr:methyltransferase domain-containing protein [Gemmatimonas sp.]